MKKKICKVFKDNNLRITIEANIKVTNFLDVTLNLTNNSYTPYTKPNNTIMYVHKLSNHPTSITKNLPQNINKRLNNLSSNKTEFGRSKQPYQQALNNSGYTYTLHYDKNLSTSKNNKRTRHRNVTWYNPPFNANMQTFLNCCSL